MSVRSFTTPVRPERRAVSGEIERRREMLFLNWLSCGRRAEVRKALHVGWLVHRADCGEFVGQEIDLELGTQPGLFKQNANRLIKSRG